MNSADKLARLAGLLYVLAVPTSGMWYGITSSVVGADAAATLVNIRATRSLFELAILAGAIGAVNHLVLAIALYRLFSPTQKTAATLALAFTAVGVPLSLAAVARQIDVLALLDADGYLPALVGVQLQMQVALAMHGCRSLFMATAIFWGLWLFPLGWAALRCGFVPRVIGWLVLLGGPFYVLAFFGPVLDPEYESSLAASIVGFSSGVADLLGEGGLGLWLLIMGTRWPKKVASASSGQPADA